MKKIIYALLCVAMLASCKKDSENLVDPSKYVYPIEPVKLKEDARVGAYYMQYKTADWQKPMADTASLGFYDALQAPVFDQHLAWAAQGRVDFFIFKWDGTSGNAMLNAAKARINAAGNAGTKIVIEYVTTHIGATNASPLSGARLQTLINEWKTLNTSFFSDDSYYKIDGRPVVLLGPLNLSTAARTSIDYKKVADSIRYELGQLNVNPYIIGEFTTGWVAPVNYPAEWLSAMDGIVLNNWATADYDRFYAFYSYSDMNYKNWQTTLAAQNVDFVPCIFPAYNNPATATQYVFDRTDKNFTDYCNVAKRNIGNDRFVLVNSWNDFQKGNALEPGKKYTTESLDILKRELKK